MRPVLDCKFVCFMADLQGRTLFFKIFIMNDFVCEVHPEAKGAYSVIRYLREAIRGLKTRKNTRYGIIVLPTDAIDEVSNAMPALAKEVADWTVGCYFHGHYKQYSDKSVCVEIVGTDMGSLIDIAEALCHTLKLQSVLLKDFGSTSLRFLYLRH